MKIEIERGLVEHAIEALEAGPHASILMNTGGIAQSLREALAAPNSVEFDGIKTDPAQQDPAAYLDEEFNCAYTPEDLDGGSAHGLIPLYAAPQPAQQEPDALHLAAMDLARTQAQRIAELEQQLAARGPLTDDQMHEVRQ